MDYAGKRNDVVDFGGETDYENMEWFKEAPPEHLVRVACLILVYPANFFPSTQRPHHQPAEPIGTPYVPDSAVIDQNEAFEFALSAAPNVLYARYKQYGQVRHKSRQILSSLILSLSLIAGCISMVCRIW